MPEFVPQFTPYNLPPFVRGYLQCVEFTFPESDSEGPGYGDAEGFHPDAIKHAKAECRKFRRMHRGRLLRYVNLRTEECDRKGYDAWECAGHDFWYSRNGHGVGFSDRGNDPVFEKLQDACGWESPFSEDDAYIGDDNLIHFVGE